MLRGAIDRNGETFGCIPPVGAGAGAVAAAHEMSEAQARVKAARMIMWNSASELKEARPDSRGA